LIWTDIAIEDLNNIAEYIAIDSEFYAKDLINRIVQNVEKLEQFPQIGRVVPELDDENIREIIYHNYRVVHRIIKEDIYIVIVSHGSFDLSDRFKIIE